MLNLRTKTVNRFREGENFEIIVIERNDFKYLYTLVL